MFQGFQQEASDFFWEMRFHNERDWFYEHKKQYEELIAVPMKQLAEDSYRLLLDEYPLFEGKVHISRIWRDARRLYGRGPLKENLWFSVEVSRIEHPPASFFFELEPATFSYGLGFWCPRSEQMETFRKSIDANPAAFERLAKDVAEMKELALGGPLYKKPKADYGEPVNGWYNRKWINVVHSEDFGGPILKAEFSKTLARTYLKLMPMHDYLIGHCG